MKNKKYITEITSDDIERMLAAANPSPGFCMRIEYVNGQLKIGIDENALRKAINGFIRNGGSTVSAERCVEVSMNPPS